MGDLSTPGQFLAGFEGVMQEHQGAVHITRTNRATGTDMHAVRQGFLRVSAAGMAALRGLELSRGDLPIVRPGFFRLVSQHLKKQPWCRTQDFPVQPAFANAPMRGHRADGQDFGDQHGHQRHHTGRGLVQKITALVRGLLVQAGHAGAGLLAILRASLLAGQGPLRCCKLFERALGMMRVLDPAQGAIRQRQGGEGFNTPIHARRELASMALWHTCDRD